VSLSSRRRFLAGAATGGASIYLLGRPTGTTAAGLARATPLAGAAFDQGVASGEPAERAITLWTRVAGAGRRAPVAYEVAVDPGFARVVARGRATVEPGAASTARVRVRGGRLRPGEQYFYRFATRDAHSPVGRFRTARPADSREPVRIAFFSCQEYIAGYYHAHRDLARRDDVDLVVCLGDYVYEQAFAGTGAVVQPVRTDTTSPTGETETLDEYRRKYALYHSDADLRAVRAAFPLAAIWDDHEVEDNYADGLPGGAAENRRLPFAERRRNGYRAWYEHLPRTAGPQRIYGAIRLGAAELLLLDTRQFRDDQPCNPGDGALSQPCPPQVTDDPRRTLLGAEQTRWLKDALARSRAAWKIVANQVMITSLDFPPGNPLNTDSWDGYGAERRELVEALPRDVAFITGDIHTFFAGNVTASGRRSARGDGPDPVRGPIRATEFVGSSITSPGIVDRAARSEAERLAAAAAADAFVLGNNQQLPYSNQAYKGYGLLEARRDELRVSYRAVRDARERRSDVFTLRRFRVEAGSPFVIDEGGPVPLPAPAPPGAPPPGGLPGQRSAAGQAIR
jgi:alkaline phosphatase D